MKFPCRIIFEHSYDLGTPLSLNMSRMEVGMATFLRINAVLGFLVMHYIKHFKTAG